MQKQATDFMLKSGISPILNVQEHQNLSLFLQENPQVPTQADDTAQKPENAKMTLKGRSYKRKSQIKLTKQNLHHFAIPTKVAAIQRVSIGVNELPL